MCVEPGKTTSEAAAAANYDSAKTTDTQSNCIEMADRFFSSFISTWSVDATVCNLYTHKMRSGLVFIFPISINSIFVLFAGVHCACFFPFSICNFIYAAIAGCYNGRLRCWWHHSRFCRRWRRRMCLLLDGLQCERFFSSKNHKLCEWFKSRWCFYPIFYRLPSCARIFAPLSVVFLPWVPPSLRHSVPASLHPRGPPSLRPSFGLYKPRGSHSSFPRQTSDSLSAPTLAERTTFFLFEDFMKVAAFESTAQNEIRFHRYQTQNRLIYSDNTVRPASHMFNANELKHK